MHSIVEDVESIFQQLIAGEVIDLYEANLSADFEFIATWLFADTRPRYWYDGVSELEARRRKARQIEFTGEMWVGNHSKNQWIEPFRARLTDMRSTKQGLWISMDIGEFHAEGDLLDYPGVEAG